MKTVCAPPARARIGASIRGIVAAPRPRVVACGEDACQRASDKLASCPAALPPCAVTAPLIRLATARRRRPCSATWAPPPSARPTARSATRARSTSTPTSTSRPSKVTAWFRKPCARTLLALVGGEPAGYAHLRHAKVPACVADRKAIELSRLYLLAAAQGMRPGRRMMAAVLAQAAELGGRTIWLGAYDRNVRRSRSTPAAASRGSARTSSSSAARSTPTPC